MITKREEASLPFFSKAVKPFPRLKIIAEHGGVYQIRSE